MGLSPPFRHRISSDEIEQIKSFFVLFFALFAVLVEAEHGADGHTLEELGREWGRIGDQEIGDCIHVFLEGRDFLLGLLNIAQVLLGFALFFLLRQLFLLALELFSLLDLDAHEGLSQRHLGLNAMNQGDRRLLMLVTVHAHIQELVEEFLVVCR